MITVLTPCDINKTVIVPGGSYNDHLTRKGYSKDYAGNDLARAVAEPLDLRPSQLNGKVLQAHMSNQGYGYTTFVEYGGILKVRNAHQANLGVKVGKTVNPGDYLGTMDSTGNSTGDHTHWETWIKTGGAWLNVDPFNPANGIQIVNDPAQLVPLGEEAPEVPIPGRMPKLPEMEKVRTTAVVTKWVNVRGLPRANSADLGDMRPGEVWNVFKTYKDPSGNIWFAVVKDLTVGWVAAYFQGQTWVETVIE